MREANQMPKVGQRVVITAENSSMYAQSGKVVVANLGSRYDRPYTVEFKGGKQLKFRQGDVWRKQDIIWE